MPGVAEYIKSQVWPFDIIQPDEVSSDLDRLIELRMIHRYQVDDDIYIQIINWWKYQGMSWAGPSSFPAPDGWTERLRYHGRGNKITESNWDSAGGFASNTGAVSTLSPVQQDSVPVNVLSSELSSELHSPLDSKQSTPLSCRDVNGDVKGDGRAIAPSGASVILPDKPKTQFTQDMEQLEIVFAQARGSPGPDWANHPKEANKRWRIPLGQIYNRCGKDARLAERIVKQVVGKMRADGLTFDAPDQILKTTLSAIIDINSPSPTNIASEVF